MHINGPTNEANVNIPLSETSWVRIEPRNRLTWYRRGQLHTIANAWFLSMQWPDDWRFVRTLGALVFVNSAYNWMADVKDDFTVSLFDTHSGVRSSCGLECACEDAAAVSTLLGRVLFKQPPPSEGVPLNYNDLFANDLRNRAWKLFGQLRDLVTAREEFPMGKEQAIVAAVEDAFGEEISAQTASDRRGEPVVRVVPQSPPRVHKKAKTASMAKPPPPLMVMPSEENELYH
jgi:hypothetical protein